MSDVLQIPLDQGTGGQRTIVQLRLHELRSGGVVQKQVSEPDEGERPQCRPIVLRSSPVPFKRATGHEEFWLTEPSPRSGSPVRRDLIAESKIEVSHQQRRILTTF